MVEQENQLIDESGDISPPTPLKKKINVVTNYYKVINKSGTD